MSNRLPKKVEALILAGTTGLTLALGGCATKAEAPAPAGTSQTGNLPPATPESPSANQEEWASREALVDKYPNAEAAASYLMGGENGDGLYSEILKKAGQRGENARETMNAPQDSIVALFGEEPEGGYPASVKGMIAQLNEYYNTFAKAYLQSVDTGTPVICTTTFTNAHETSGNTVMGIVSQTCTNTNTLPNTEEGALDWTAGLSLTVEQQANADGKDVWVIVAAEDAES